MSDFNPSGVALHNGNFLGLPYTLEEASIVVLPLTWDVTTSYRDGTCKGPQAIIDASYQLDLSSPFLEKAWNTKIGTVAVSEKWLGQNKINRAKAKQYIEFLENGGEPNSSKEMSLLLNEVNASDLAFHRWTYEEAKKILANGKKLVTVGGDHSVSHGPIKAHAERAPISILHIDAHADLRDTYEGFPHSHASIMHLAKDLPGVENIVQVGIRDFAPMEAEAIKNSHGKIATFFDWDLQKKLAQGHSWHEISKEIISKLGDSVYLSFDIDGLDPRFCPNTGTPVPGGLELNQLLYLLEQIVESGRTLVGADLVEVSPGQDEWDANVGARALFHICQLIEKSSKR